MIVVRITGGLGNQLFQYALGRHLALLNNTELKLDLSFYRLGNHRKFSLQHFNIDIIEANKKDIPYIRRLDKSSNIVKSLYHYIIKDDMIIYDEKKFLYDQEVLNLKGNIYLNGYWQSEKYFENIKKIILSDFTLRNINPKLNNIIILIKESQSLSLHVRRGDYINNSLHPVLTSNYYYNCIDVLKKTIDDLIIFIISDDIEWCKKNLKINNNHYFLEGNYDYEDMYLSSLCKYHIIANSTFSWWGAWLSQSKKVFAPSKWFHGDRSILTTDLIPKNWDII